MNPKKNMAPEMKRIAMTPDKLWPLAVQASIKRHPDMADSAYHVERECFFHPEGGPQNVRGLRYGLGLGVPSRSTRGPPYHRHHLWAQI